MSQLISLILSYLSSSACPINYSQTANPTPHNHKNQPSASNAETPAALSEQGCGSKITLHPSDSIDAVVGWTEQKTSLIKFIFVDCCLMKKTLPFDAVLGEENAVWK